MSENKYHRGKIYRITDLGYNQSYIGSTIQSLSVRMAGHRTSFNKYQSNKYGFVTVFNLFEQYGIENCKIELVEMFPCQSREELLKREGFVIQATECINKHIMGRTSKEYREQNFIGSTW